MGALKVSFYAYPLVNALHIAAIGTLFACVLMMDLRILGALGELPRDAFIDRMRAIALGVALPIAVATGIALFAIRAQQYATNPAFLVKMTLLAAAGLNLVVFRRAASAGSVPNYSAGARASALVSLCLWPAILVAGRFIGFV